MNVRHLRWKPLITMVALFAALQAGAQTPPEADPPIRSDIPTLHIGTSLTLVDVIAEQVSGKLRSRELVKGLTQADFRVFDNGHEVLSSSFDVGAEHTTRAVALWIVVQCNMGFPIGWGSGYMRGKTRWLAPGLAALQPTDVVGVAHWCDDGTAKLDVLPSADKAPALAAVEAILKAPEADGQSRQGELALQKLFADVLTATEAMTPQRLPVLLFLYGDHSATYRNEAETIDRSLLESSGIVFGLTEQDSQEDLSLNLGGPGQISHLIHHYAAETGGQYLSASKPDLLANALAYMLTGVHLRYVLGFKPQLLDGTRHTLRVELTKAARKLYANPELRFRDEYIPVRRVQAIITGTGGK